MFNKLFESAKAVGADAHKGGTYICIEGPMFSSRAESNIYRSWDVDVIGMTNYQEAKLAREAEICYATIALSTDYDCWLDTEENVDVQMVLEVMKKNVLTAKQIIKHVIPALLVERTCKCRKALEYAIITDRTKISDQTKKRLKPIIEKYM